ncbi:hypothetical protein RchiOBHm_Chr4g0435101 [Rosa chinensis]|uniref:Uncharacterized protein n=1 Tax=Rosa chinensis TaxID=74649 RepID=A0A2P6R1P9_ROSCH|nr:hypothetical protein RchiOBHm_Chr4g0435101 [Rosa chinensis]
MKSIFNSHCPSAHVLMSEPSSHSHFFFSLPTFIVYLCSSALPFNLFKNQNPDKPNSLIEIIKICSPFQFLFNSFSACPAPPTASLLCIFPRSSSPAFRSRSWPSPTIFLLLLSFVMLVAFGHS